MKKIKSILFAVIAAASLSSCTLDSASFGVSTSTYYPTYAPVYRPVIQQPAIYHTPSYRYVDVRPDWMRYGGNWVPARRHHRCHY